MPRLACKTAATVLTNAKRVTLANGESIGFDVLDRHGPVQNSAIPGAEHALAVRPIESFIAAVQGIEQRIFDNASAGLSNTHRVLRSAGAAALSWRWRWSRVFAHPKPNSP